MNHPPPHHHHQGPPGLPPQGRFPGPGGPPPPFINGPPPHQQHIIGGPPGVPPGAHFGAPPPPPPGAFMPPNLLPPGWTEHKAPDGMAYFYNAASGQSSWVRPTMQQSPIPPPPGNGIPPPPGMSGYPSSQQPLYPPGMGPPPGPAPVAPALIEETGKGKKGKKPKKEKAVKKTRILESPWFIVETNLENTFFYNKDTKVSIWIPTPELEIVLAKMGQEATEKIEAERRARDQEEQERLQALKRPFDTDAAGQVDGDKRSRNDSEPQGTEMTEDDVAWQLAAMEEIMEDQDQDQHMASQDEDDDEDDEDMQERLRMLQGSSTSRAAVYLEILPENIQEREMAFLDMMRERGVTPFDTVDMAFGKVEKDPRYRLIPDQKDKTALFDSFCVIRAREIKEAREKKEQQEETEEKEEKEHGRKIKDRHSASSSSRDSKSHTTTKSSSSSSASKTSDKPEDVYRRLMEDYTTKTSTWLDFMTKYRVDPRFLGLKPGSLRESTFRQYLSDLKKGIIHPPSKSSSSSDKDKRSSSSSSHSRSSSTKYKATDAEIEEFMSLLKETKKDILYEHKNSSSVEWRKIKKLIDRDRRYDAVGSSTERELLFRKYADRVIQRRD
ncbi:transcription elongation regulator [Linnemannia elongata]|nr:transcription elongation regulator [Linnemannia elongata]